MTQGVFPVPNTTQAMTLISRKEFANVAELAFESVFTSAYKSYMMVIESIGCNIPTASLALRFKYNGTATESSGYYGTFLKGVYSGASTYVNMNNEGSGRLTEQMGSLDASDFTGQYFIYNVGRGAGRYAALTGIGFQSYNINTYSGGFQCRSVVRPWDGFVLVPGSGLMSGSVSLYGLA